MSNPYLNAGRASSGGGGTNSYLQAGRTGVRPVPKKKGGGLLGSVERYTGFELLGNLAQDVGETAVGVVPGLVTAGRAAAADLNANLHGHSTGLLSSRHGGEFGKQVVFPTIQQYKDYYGHDVLHHLYQHPLQPILDVATVASLGTGAAAKAGLISGERAAIVTRSPRLVAQGKGPKVTDLSSHVPLVKARETAMPKVKAALEGTVAKLPKQEHRVGHGEAKRYGAKIQAQVTQAALGRLHPEIAYTKAIRGLSADEFTALHFRAQGVHPVDLAEVLRGTPNGAALTPKVAALMLTPSKKMLRAEPAAQTFSGEMGALSKGAGTLGEEAAAARPELALREASALLDRPAKRIPGGPDPYYFPHTLEPSAAKNPLLSKGGGKAPPRTPGTMKHNTSTLLLSGKLHLRSDILGPEFRRRVTHIKYSEIHNALRRAAPRYTRAEIEAMDGVPKGWEYLRADASQRIPFDLRGEGPAAGVVPVTRDRAALLPEANDRLRKLRAEHDAALDEIAAAKFGSIGQRDVNARTANNKRAARQSAGTSGASAWKSEARPTVKNERRAQAERLVEEFIAQHPDHPVAQAWRRRTDAIDQLQAAINPSPETLFDLRTSKLSEGFTTAKPEDALLSNGRYYLVPSKMAKAATGEFTRSSNFVYNWVHKPLMVWRSIILGLRVGFLTNNLVGNSIMYAVKTGGQGALRDLFAAFLETHGRETGLRLLRNQATPPALRADLYREFYPEQIRGTFGRTQSPAASATGAAANKAVGVGRAVTGAIPKVTSKVAEEYPRRALIRHYIRHSPEFKKVYNALPKETRTFQDAARQILEGTGGKAFQRYTSKQVDHALGNYTRLTPVERNVLRNTAPFYSWYRAIVTTTLHLAVDTPLRANILGQIGRIGKEQSDQSLGEVPSFLKGAVGLGEGKGGTKKVLATQGLDPYATLEQLRRGSLKDIGSLGLNPFLEGPIQYLQRHRGPVSPGALALSPLVDLARGLPPSRLISPTPPSKLYPNRNRNTELLANLGVPVKEYNPAEARRQARLGR